MKSFADFLYEVEIIDEKFRIKISAKGKKTKRRVCPKGMKAQGGKCVKIGSKEKIARKKGLRKAVRTKKSKGAGAEKKRQRLTKKAMKKRKSRGL